MTDTAQFCFVICGLLGALLVIQSDSSRKDGPVVAHLHTFWMKQSAAEGASKCC